MKSKFTPQYDLEQSRVNIHKPDKISRVANNTF